MSSYVVFFCVCAPFILVLTCTLVFDERLAQLMVSPFFVKPLLLGLSTNVLRVSGLGISIMWGSDSSARVERLLLNAAMVSVDCVPVDDAGVGDWVYITPGS